ncbi:MAG: hypothetical protein KBE15_05540 [Budvicia sp.]|nr:hypothetical protein [Budvicia sp.]
MRRLVFILMMYPFIGFAQPAQAPEESAMLSCLLAKSSGEDTRYKNISVRNVRIRGDNSSNGMSYSFPYGEKMLGYFEKFGKGDVLFNEKNYSVQQSLPLTLLDTLAAAPLGKFDFSMVGWAEVDIGDRQYLCINFPFGSAGLGNGERDLTYAFILDITEGQTPVLYSWAGDLRALTAK